MNPTWISTRDRRVAGIGGIAVAALLMLARGVPAVNAWQSEQLRAVAALHDRLARLRLSRNSFELSRRELASRQREGASLDSAMIHAPSAAIAGAELSGILRIIADSAGLRLTSLQTRPDSTFVSSLGHAVVRANGVGGTAAVAAFLRLVAEDPRILVVRELSLSRLEAITPAEAPVTFRVDAVVETIYRIPAPPRLLPANELTMIAQLDSVPLDSLEELIAYNDALSAARSPGTSPNAMITSGPGLVIPRPTLTLRAIVGGPPWQAVIDGLPGIAPNTLMRAGDSAGKLTVRKIFPDSVVVSAPDTTWVLRFKRSP